MRDHHPYQPKLPGDRVKAPIHPASHEFGYYYGTVIKFKQTLLVKWDRPPTYMSKITELLPCILCTPSPTTSLPPQP